LKTRLLIIFAIMGAIILVSGIYVYSQMHDCLNPPLWMKVPHLGFEKCFELFMSGNLPDWTQAKKDYEKKQALRFKLIEQFKDKPEVVAFYSKYDDVNISVRDDHVSYFAGNEDGYSVRMNFYFDQNYDLDYIDFHCYYQNEHQFEFPQEDIATKIARYDCKEHRNTVNPEPKPDYNPVPKWTIPEELSKIGCTDAMVDHLKKYSNAFDEKWYGEGVAIEDIGLPWRVDQYALDQCMQNISELRNKELYGCNENEVYFHGICMTPETKEKAQSVGEKENEN